MFAPLIHLALDKNLYNYLVHWNDYETFLVRMTDAGCPLHWRNVVD